MVGLAAVLASCGKGDPASKRSDPGLLFDIQTTLARMAADSHNAFELKAIASREAKRGPRDTPAPDDADQPILTVKQDDEPGERFVARSTDGRWRIYDQVTHQEVGDPDAVLDQSGAEEAAATLNRSDASSDEANTAGSPPADTAP